MKKWLILLLVVSLHYMISCQDNKKEASAIPYGNNQNAGKYYDIRGFKMYAEVYGEGQPLLLIHGNGGSIKDLSSQIPFFSKNYKVIVADSRAQGKSKDNSDSLTYEIMADDFAALLTSLQIDSAYIVGWSDGGINGLLLAIRHPQKVKKLAITGANLRPDTTAVFPEVLNIVQPAYDTLKNKSVKNENEKTQEKLVRLMIEQPNIPLVALHSVKCPVLVIGGDHDLIKPEHTLEIFKNIPKAYLWVLPNSGHSTLIVYKDQFNATVENFFAQPYRNITKAGRFN